MLPLKSSSRVTRQAAQAGASQRVLALRHLHFFKERGENILDSGRAEDCSQWQEVVKHAGKEVKPGVVKHAGRVSYLAYYDWRSGVQ